MSKSPFNAYNSTSLADVKDGRWDTASAPRPPSLSYEDVPAYTSHASTPLPEKGGVERLAGQHHHGDPFHDDEFGLRRDEPAARGVGTYTTYNTADAYDAYETQSSQDSHQIRPNPSAPTPSHYTQRSVSQSEWSSYPPITSQPPSSSTHDQFVVGLAVGSGAVIPVGRDGDSDVGGGVGRAGRAGSGAYLQVDEIQEEERTPDAFRESFRSDDSLVQHADETSALKDLEYGAGGVGSGAIGRGALEPLNYEDAPNGGATTTSRNLSSDPTKKSPLFDRLIGTPEGRYPLEQRIEAKKRGIGKQKVAIVCWTLTAVMVGLMIWELVYNWRQQGSPFAFKPSVNPMLGPSQFGLVHLGARWPPCMRYVPQIPLNISIACPNNTANPPTSICTIEQICGFGGFHKKEPDQWWRFITPIFLHAGLIHLAFNMFAQCTLSAQVEREMGSVAFIILYFAAGIFGNVLGGNFALVGLPSLGASGAIFGTLAVMWVDLFAHWGIEYRPGRKLFMLILDLIVGIGIGFIPGVDNFAHLGGFLMGLLCAMIFYPVVSTTKRHRIIMWIVRIATIPLVVILFVLLIKNFYKDNPFAACSWCRYLSCIPTASNNRCQGYVVFLPLFSNVIIQIDPPYLFLNDLLHVHL
ncbi:uncharacterized protein EI90DRAFT_2997656 [Cantharellus anzutake]|uniref:uncharacterized protein n=1 Tax=Cantharellus anzutake TaxID=1750568 RepID=UPI0019038CFC|nr:uncharacterized protein EI90DRAFT_2997656 [Cantharellus anzutake]KAF8328875.1 hypothetical protein EI90DRAFT_2997656 [Cantharellus anzutake]